MGSGRVSSIRAYPRAFVPGLPDPLPDHFELPDEDWKKFRNVLRLGSGDRVVVLPNDGRAVLCQIEGKGVRPEETSYPDTDAKLNLTLALGIPKPDSLENAVRMATEIGVSHFCLFTAERTVVKWTDDKWAKRLKRLEAIAREASEVCFRTHLPTFSVLGDLGQVFEQFPDAVVLSEGEDVMRTPPNDFRGDATIVIGPEGGWAPREVELIGERGVTMGKRVFRVDTAVAGGVRIVFDKPLARDCRICSTSGLSTMRGDDLATRGGA